MDGYRYGYTATTIELAYNIIIIYRRNFRFEYAYINVLSITAACMGIIRMRTPYSVRICYNIFRVRCMSVQ